LCLGLCFAGGAWLSTTGFFFNDPVTTETMILTGSRWCRAFASALLPTAVRWTTSLELETVRTGPGGGEGDGIGTVSVLLTAAALPFLFVAVTLQVSPLP